MAEKKVTRSMLRARRRLSENLQTQIDRKYPGAAPSAAYRLMAVSTGLSPTTIHRVIQGSHGTVLDTVVVLADLFRVKPADLIEGV